MNKLIRVKPIKKDTWSGFIRFNNTKDYISPYYDAGGSIVTGLTLEDEERLGKLLKRDLSAVSPFWHEYKILMTDKERQFNIENPEQELAYLFMLSHRRVANSELERHLFPAAEYIIYNEEMEAKVKNEKFSVKRKATTLFNELSLNQMRDILKLYPGYTKVDGVSSDVVEARLYELMEKDPAKFNELVGDKKLDMKVFLKDLTQAKILRKNRSAFYYGTDNIGHDEESTIMFLENPDNQGLLIALKQELEKDK